MVHWHETLAARVGVRVCGGGVLSAAWCAGTALYARIHAHPPAPAHGGELALCLLLVVLLVIGNALLFVGAGLWKQVRLPARWSAALVEPRQFDVLLDRHSADRLRERA